jgi:type I restriction enzyme, S subunit
MNEESYQETLIGEIPSEWEIGKLGNYLDLLRNGITKRQNHDGIGYPVSRIQTISEDDINPDQVGYLTEVDEDEIEKFRLYPGDILFSHINSDPQIGRSVVYEGYPDFLLHGMNLLRLRTNEKLDSHYLNFLFNLYRKLGIFVGIASRSVNQSSINQGKMKSLEIIVPPLSEQQAIAKVLSTVRQAIEATEGVIAAACEMKRSMMKHLFTYGPVPIHEADRVPLKETEVGAVPQDWEVVSIKDLGEVITGQHQVQKKISIMVGDTN